MKRIILTVLLCLCLLPSLVRAAEKITYVNVPSVNIRANAGTEFDVIKSVPIGYSLKILSEKEKWLQVELKDKTVGWVYKTMVTDEIPVPIRFKELELQFNTQAVEFEETKKELMIQTNLNAQLESKLKETQQKLDEVTRKNQLLERMNLIKLAGIGIVILLLGWAGGYLAGFFKRQAEDKRFLKMMIEANSLK